MDPASISVSHRVHDAGRAPSHEVALPDTPGLKPYSAPLPDRIGDVAREHAWLPVAGAALGAGTVAKLQLGGGAGLLRRIAGPIGGAIAGGVLALGAGTLVSALVDRAAKGAAGDGAKVADATVKQDEDLRVMTFNLHGGQGPGGEHFTDDEKLDRLAAQIRESDPDIVLLQEVDQFATRSNKRDILAELSDRLHPDGAVFTARGTRIGGGQEGTGVLTFHGIEVADARGLMHPNATGDGVRARMSGAFDAIRGFAAKTIGTDPPKDGPHDMPRVTTDAMLVTPAGNNIRVLSGHYSWQLPGIDSQANQVAPVAGLIDGWDGPTIWGADWNQTSESAVGKHERELLNDVGLEDTFDDKGIKSDDQRRLSAGGDEPHARIDRIYRSEEFTTKRVRVEPYLPGTDSSDHHPVVADLHLTADAATDD